MQRFGLAIVLALGLATPAWANECTDNYGKRYKIFSEILSICEELAGRGDVEAQVTLGMLYEEGSRSSPPNIPKAAKWFSGAAKQGHSGAQWWLGTLLVRGEGVLQDFSRAAALFRQAAEQGESSAKWDLGKMYRDGRGVPKDLVRAHMWFNLTAADGFSVAAQDRDAVATQMTSEQIAKAQLLAREWWEKHQKAE